MGVHLAAIVALLESAAVELRFLTGRREDLYDSVAEGSDRHYTGQGYNSQESTLAALSRDADKIVAFLGDQIVGAVSFGLEYAREIWVHDPGRGQVRWTDSDEKVVYVYDLGSLQAGVGTRLMQEVAARAGEYPVMLTHSGYSKTFYQKLGFQCSRGICRRDSSPATDSCR